VLPAATVPRVLRVPWVSRSPAPAAGDPPQRDSYAGAQSSQAHIPKSQCTVTLQNFIEEIYYVTDCPKFLRHPSAHGALMPGERSG
jgi:hypothetical protein